MSPNLNWSDVFLMVRLELCGFEKNTTEVKYVSHHVISGDTRDSHSITGDINLHHLVM